MERILIIGAHFDDAELGVGATAAKLVSQGKKVYKLTLTDNVTNFTARGINVEYLKSKEQSTKACEILGIEEVEFEPARCTELVYTTEIMQRVEKVIFDLNIDTVFIHFSSDMNRDHIEANKICVTAARHCRNIIQYQSNGYVLDNVYYPTYFVDVTDFIELKKKALDSYGSEHNRANRLFETSIDRSRVWGYANEVGYAEGFAPIKMMDD